MSNWSRTLLGVQTLSEITQSPAINSSTLSIDLSLGTTFEVTMNASVTSFQISNTPTNAAGSFNLILTGDGTSRAFAWGSAVTWSGGSPPTLTATNGKKDIFSFITLNNGTNWYAFVGGQNF